jgi:hypothetical protein
MTITNASDFKAALGELSRPVRRVLAARFAENVLALCPDPRVKATVNLAKREDVVEEELAAALQSAKAASVDSYTQCGRECDWNKQAGHFVAEAALACVKPPAPAANAAWEAAMHARMARTCASIAAGSGTKNGEDEAQYRILAAFLNR